MKFNKTLLGLGVLTAFSASGWVSTASAVAIADGSYILTINSTPEFLGYPLISDVGIDGAYNTSFSYELPSVGQSLGLWDDINLLSGGAFDLVGDHIIEPANYGNGNSGEIGMTVAGGEIGFTSFQVDCIGGTIMGDLCQDMTDFSGSNGTTNASETTLNLATRFASLGGIPTFPANLPFSGNFTTGNVSHLSVGNMNGTPVANVGDINGDGIDDYTATYVSINIFGAEWADFQGIPYVEAWNTQILSASPVPVPAAIWLFGSGLIGLAGLARRK
ncbi:MAG: VPLPA-CTERM sorting domain-containing protein [Gammaproteobacteria bacterium]|nr:VPLPA-CTERM sorting domain-containing protein [Gammaproteobacteria bacterium]